MRRLSRYPLSSIHVPGVAGRGTPKPPATTATSACNRLGHTSAVCWHTQPQEPYVNPQQKCTTTKQSSKPTHAVVARLSDSDEEEFDNNQLAIHKASSRHTNKLTTVLQVEGIALEMEVDTGAELSTIPAYIYQQKLHDIKLYPSCLSTPVQWLHHPSKGRD